MTWLSDSTQQLAGAWRSSAYAGHGIRGDAVPQTGLHGASILWGTGGNITLPAEAADEFRLLVLTRPAGLPGLVIGEDGSIEVPEDSPAGTHTGTWRGHKNAAVFGPDPSTYSIVIGGSVLTGGATLDDVSAGGGLGVAPPTVLGGGATLDDVAASGTVGGRPAPSAARTYTIYPAPGLPNPVAEETVLVPTYAHDLDALLEYTWDWAPWLTDASDTAQAMVLEYDGGITEVQQQLAGAQITAWVQLAGLAVGALPRMKCHITTVGGRVDDRSIQLQVVQR